MHHSFREEFVAEFTEVKLRWVLVEEVSPFSTCADVVAEVVEGMSVVFEEISFCVSPGGGFWGGRFIDAGG